MLDTAATSTLRPAPKKPADVDVEIGKRIRLRRKMLKISQEKLAKAVGVTFQQIQKYEKGTNRVGGSRMQQIASVLGAPVGFFFHDSDGSTIEENAILKFASTNEGLALIRAFSKIKDSGARRQIIGIAETVAAHSTAH